MSRFNNGWFVVPRSAIEDYMTDGIDLALIVWLIGRANFVDSTHAVRAGHERVTLSRGQLITSIKEISEALKVPPNTIRGRLHLLKKRDFSTIKTTSTGTIITINNYNEMQEFESYNHKQNHNQTTNGPQTDHNILTNVTNVTKETNLTIAPNSDESVPPLTKKRTRVPKIKKEPEEPKPKKESTGVNEVIARYCDIFKARFGTFPKISQADAGCLGRLTKAHGKDKALQIVETYFSLIDPWLSGQCYPTALIEKNVNKILVVINRQQNVETYDYGIKPLNSGE